MKHKKYYPSNPTMQHAVLCGVKSDYVSAKQMRERATLSKVLVNLCVVWAAVVLTWLIAEKIPVEMIVLMFLCGGLVVAVAMVFPRRSALFSPLFSVLLGASMGAVAALVDREFRYSGMGAAISDIVNVSIVVSSVTLCVMAILRRFYILSIINKYSTVVIGSLGGFFMSLAMMRVLSWVYSSGQIPLYYDSYQGHNIVFAALVAVLMATSTVYHLRVLRRYEHRKYPRYMEWYLSMGFVFSLVWFYNECLNMVLSRSETAAE